jgi:hypothetical protein
MAFFFVVSDGICPVSARLFQSLSMLDNMTSRAIYRIGHNRIYIYIIYICPISKYTDFVYLFMT